MPDDDRLRTAKLEALAEFAAGAGHEINNPLATIINHAQILLRGEQDPARIQSLLSIGAQARRIRDMIGDVMLFGRPPTPHPASVLLSDVVDEVVAALADDFSAAELSLKTDIPPELTVWADRTQLCVVLSSLLRNSLEASDAGKSVQLLAANSDAGTIEITAIDHGYELSELEREHLFDPFFSGRQAGRGLGFGLSKSWRIITLHGGTIDVESAKQRTAFHIKWPAVDPRDST
ncbi:MAG: HAMP domain-containing sensor histidine kinase [Planctomycetota bacterium]|nr:HAMP domain-containing sensor histidine kinase [Planctomycetota bacterium]MDA1214552.1 HAMP domain-containing sensor histidine kinase [Planctomycetota bacterium]